MKYHCQEECAFFFRKVYSLFHLRRTKTSLPRVQIPYQKVEGREVSYCRGGQNTAVLSLCQSDCWSPTNIKCLFVWKWWFANVHGFHLSFRRQSYIELQVGHPEIRIFQVKWFQLKQTLSARFCVAFCPEMCHVKTTSSGYFCHGYQICCWPALIWRLRFALLH